MKKLNKKQQEKFDLIRAYLNSDLGKNGAFLDDNDVSCVYLLRSISFNACGLRISGKNGHFKPQRDYILNNQLYQLYNALRRGDEDFVIFVTEKTAVPIN